MPHRHSSAQPSARVLVGGETLGPGSPLGSSRRVDRACKDLSTIEGGQQGRDACRPDDRGQSDRPKLRVFTEKANSHRPNCSGLIS